MRDALNASGRPIVFSACEWAVNFPATWMEPVANSWRSTYDIQNYWECVVPHIDWTNIYADFAGPGGFSDMDILEVGNGVLTEAESEAHFSLWAIMKSPLLIGCDLSTPECQHYLYVFNNSELLAVSQDPLGRQARRVASAGDPGIPHGKSGRCGSEELPQNTIIAPCNASDPLQQWQMLPNGTIVMTATGECLQLDSGQSGCCGQDWAVWTNNAASGLCNDPASCCGAKQQLWTYDATKHTLVNQVTSQCLSVHTSGFHNVGVMPCQPVLQGLQAWTWRPASGQFVSAASPPSGKKSCLARTPDVRGGATEVWAGPLAGGDTVVLLFNRNLPAASNITATWASLGLAPGTAMHVRDLWAHADVGVANASITALVQVHGVAVFRLTPTTADKAPAAARDKLH